MPLEDQLEKQIEKNIQIAKQLSIEIENLNRQSDELLKELKVSPDQLSTFIDRQDAFTEEDWNALLTERKKLEEKLLLALAQVRNPKKTAAATKSLNVAPHWLFVR